MQHDILIPKNKYVVPLLEKELTETIIGAAMEVHKELGPDLLDSAYKVCMEHESALRALSFERLVHLPLNYKGLDLDAG